MIAQTFGDMLYYPQSDCLVEFPSPGSLKHRIIISTKPPKEFLETKNIRDRGNGKESPEEETLVKGTLGIEYDADDRVRWESHARRYTFVNSVSVLCLLIMAFK